MLRNREASWPLLDVCSEAGRRWRERRGGAIHFNPPPPTWAKYAPFSFSPIFTFCCRGGTDEWKDTSLLSILQIDVRGTRDTDATDVTRTHARSEIEYRFLVATDRELRHGRQASLGRRGSGTGTISVRSRKSLPSIPSLARLRLPE